MPKTKTEIEKRACDRCGAPALVEVDMGESVIDLCGHHHSEHEPFIASKGYAVRELQGARIAWTE